MTDLRQRTPRVECPSYLAWLRKQSCACGCGAAPPSDPAHIRSGSIHYGKEYPGLQRKPSDCWAVPLHRDHHRAQHDFGDEVLWWARHGKDPFYLALQYNARYKLETSKDPTVNTVRAKRPTEADYGLPDRPSSKATRPAKRAQRPRQAAKIAKRKAAWPAKGTRKIKSRGFNGRK